MSCTRMVSVHISSEKGGLDDMTVADCIGRINDDQKEAYQHLNIVGLVGSIE